MPMLHEPSARADSTSTRLLAGASLGRRSGRLKTVLWRGVGEGWQLKAVEVEARTSPSPEPGRFAEELARALKALCDRLDVSYSSIEVLGLHDPPAGGDAGVELAAEVAEHTGLTVVSHFHARAGAVGGIPATASQAADWLALHSPNERRLVLHLGATLRVVLLEMRHDPPWPTCFEAGPCCNFLDGLVQRLSDGRIPYDPGGHFAVQGRLNETILNDWSSHPFLMRPIPRFTSGGEFGDEFVDGALALARELRLSGRDVLCTANHFVVRNLEAALRRMPSRSLTFDRVIVTGGGARNGLLWKLVCEHFEKTPVVRCDSVGAPSEARRALQAALLAYCATENLPTNMATRAGPEKRAVLGVVTPGSQRHWDQWVCSVADRLEASAEERIADAA